MTADGRVRRLLAADFAMSFMWVWSGALIKILAHEVLAHGAHQLQADFVKYAVYAVNPFFFAIMSKVTKGGACNPLFLIPNAVSGDFSEFLFTVGARIPTQVVGSIYGVKHIMHTFPSIGRGPRLTVDIATGAMTEGLLAFFIVTTSLGLSRKISNSFFRKNWISSVSKLSLHIVASDITGGCMNPAAVMGWAFANGEHITKEHLVVYWLAPVVATLAAVWVFGILVQPKKDEPSAAKKTE